MQQIYIYIDDSGIFHKKHDYFVYAGYAFTDKNEKEVAKRQYRTLSKKIAKSLGRDDELKSYGLGNNHKRALYNVMRKHESLSVCVNLNRIYDQIMQDKKSIHRFKDYALKRVIKGKVQELIGKQLIDPNEDISICVFVDEQMTATDGYYDLSQSIKEELEKGVSNFDYSVFHKPVFSKKVLVDVQFCDSSNNYLIQASDILANRHFISYVKNLPLLRQKDAHHLLHLPY